MSASRTWNIRILFGGQMLPTSGFDVVALMLYAITNRKLLVSDSDAIDEASRCAAVVEQAAIWAANGVDIIQLREKDLPSGMLVELSKGIRAEILSCRLPGRPATRLLINSRPDVAIAAEADGVHLTSGPDGLTAGEVRTIFAAADRPKPYLSVACHTISDVELARAAEVDLIVFAPVFGKEGVDRKTLPGAGLEALREACRTAATVPVVALGGVTVENASDCLKAGAAGIAAIRLFQMDPATWRGLAA